MRMHGRARVAAAAVALSVALAGCGSGNDAKVDANGKPVVTIMVVRASTQIPMKEMAWVAEVEKACDCTIRWKEVGDTNWQQQKTASLAAGDIEDVSIFAYNTSDVSQNPIFEELSQHLDKMPNVKKVVEGNDMARKTAMSPDGTMYGLPTGMGRGYRASVRHMMINKTWLDRLGFGVPTTWDELKTVLEAFKTQDPNGNGQADEIPAEFEPLGTSGFTWWTPYLFLNSTGIVTGGNGWETGIYVKDGKVGNYMTTENFRQVTEYLHELLSEGLIPAASLTQDGSKHTANIQNDGKTAKVGVTFGWALRDFSKLEDQYVGMPVPAAPGTPEDQVTWDVPTSGGEYGGPNFFVAKDAKNKDAIWKIANAMYSERIAVEQLQGSIPEYVTDEGDHTYSLTAKGQDITEKLPSLMNRLAGFVPEDVTIKNDSGADYLQAIEPVYAEQYSHYDHEKDAMPIYVQPADDDKATLANNNTQIFDYASPVIAKWIQKGGVDKEWDSFVATLNRLGVNDNIAIWQKWYDEYTK